MTPIAFAVALCASAQPLTQDELTAHEDALNGVSVLTYHGGCGLSGFREGDVLYIGGVSWDGTSPAAYVRLVAMVDAKTGKRIAGWDDMQYSEVLSRGAICKLNLEPVSLSPARVGVVVHAAEGDALLLARGDRLESQLDWSTQGKDKRTFRVRKSIGNGLFDVELKQGKHVDVYRWDGEMFYQDVMALNPYISKAHASSELTHEGDFTYSAVEAIDGAPETTWAEATNGTGVGEALNLTLDGSYVLKKLKLIPGCGFTEDLWLKNERIKKVKLTFDDKAEQVAELEDARKPGEWKTIAITHDKPTTSLKLEILDVYPGGAWKDGCISEVAIEPKPLSSTGALDKVPTFLGANCKTDWAAVTALWKTTGKPAAYDALRDVNKRLGKPNLLMLVMKDEKQLDSISLEKCESVSALVGTLPKDDLAFRLCAMKFEDVRHAFGDPPEKKQHGVLEYPFSGGKLTIRTEDRVTTAKLSCLP
jgi:hypothetical protein